MAESTIRTYEALFLMGQSVGTDLAAAVEHIRGILTRHGAEILVLRKWDERKLAYAIRGQKRGIYLLSYFKAPTGKVASIERDCVLSETVLRSLVLKADYMGETELNLAKREEHLAVEAKLRSAAKPAEGEAPGPAAAPAAADPAGAPAAPAPAGR